MPTGAITGIRPGAGQGVDDADVHVLGLADEAEVERALDTAVGVADRGALQLAGADQAAVLAADADGQGAGVE